MNKKIFLEDVICTKQKVQIKRTEEYKRLDISTDHFAFNCQVCKMFTFWQKKNYF